MTFFEYTSASVFRLAMIALLFVAVTFVSCKKDDDEKSEPQPQPTVVEAPVQFMVHPMRGEEHMEYGIENFVRLPDGRKVSFDLAQLYLSGFELLKADGSAVRLADSYALVTEDEATFRLGKAPTGDYTGIRFQIGVDSAANHSDPSLRAADHPLALRAPSMHWSWNTGYIFIKAEGDVDCELGMSDDEPQCTPFEYHIGTLPMLRTVQLNHGLTVEANSGGTYHVEIDWLKLFDGLTLPDDSTTITMDNRPLAEKVASNGPKMFRIAHH